MSAGLARQAGLPSFEAAALSHVGCLREENQDDFLVRTDIGIWAVADGVGGLADGRLASRTLVERLGRIRPAPATSGLLSQVRDLSNEANRALIDHARRHGSPLGSTLVALLSTGSGYSCLWAGDSRCYLIRDGRIDRISEDHTEAGELVRRGVLSPREALTWPRRHVITRAIGVEDEVRLDLREGELAENDVFLLCSDGLTTHLSDDEILGEVRGRSLAAACQALIDRTLQRGASDNVTVVLVGVRRAGGAAEAPDGGDRTLLMIPRKVDHV